MLPNKIAPGAGIVGGGGGSSIIAMIAPKDMLDAPRINVTIANPTKIFFLILFPR